MVVVVKEKSGKGREGVIYVLYREKRGYRPNNATQDGQSLHTVRWADELFLGPKGSAKIVDNNV